MTPSPERAELASALRALRQRTGLSLTGLEERTPFSRSSWGRYLKGETLPPREAVRALCRLAGEPDGRCLALWEIAEAADSGRAAHAPPDEAAPPPVAPPPAPPPDGAPRIRPWRLTAVLTAVLAVLAGGVTAAALLEPGPAGTVRASPSSEAAPPPPRCRGAACEGKDPMNMLCGNGPDTLGSYRTTAGARLELRHSRRCGTSWARMWATAVGDRIEMTAAGPTRSAEVADVLDAKAYLYTPMTATVPGTVVRACFHRAGKRECFEATVR
ncbi:helix-turn-helix domain-containing protein [Streptomyces sp. NPDC000348]|uniref:helix-turn-helix domain-containing protein n=1 Tax=Streptomyces sp. NPDC000348 TaxID=3364538 RepID=UPI0036AA898E